jgi:zinc transport system permease protein
VDELIIRALCAGLLLAAMLGPLGSFVVWRRMAYFGDTVAHSALLGVAFSLLVGEVLPMHVSIFFVAILVAVLLARSSRDTRFSSDTMLGILSHGALALGLVLVAVNRDAYVDVNAYLFGDILAIDWADVAVLAGLMVVVSLTVVAYWRSWLMATIDPAIARTEGVNVARTNLVFTLLLAGVIAVAIKLTGMLLITALLVIPAATARSVATSPVQMAVFASIAGMLSVGTGLLTAFHFNTPTAPMMVVVAVVLFMFSRLVKRP